jgi:putative hydrolase of the HAD superfamily
VIRGILFDAGATLLYADPPVKEVYFRAFASDGARATREELGGALEKTWREIRERRLPNRYGGATGERGFWESFVRRARFHLDGGALSDLCFAELVAHFLRPDSWSVYPDVLPALEALCRNGYSLAIVSNWDSTLGNLLDAHGLSSKFSAVLISAVEGSAKPHAEIFHRACSRLGLRAEEALHVGDSLEEDYEASRTAGLSALLLDRDGRHPEIGDRISTLAELPERLSTLVEA